MPTYELISTTLKNVNEVGRSVTQLYAIIFKFSMLTAKE